MVIDDPIIVFTFKAARYLEVNLINYIGNSL